MVCTKRLSISLAEEYIFGLTVGHFDSNFFPASLVNRYISSVMEVAGPSREIPAATSTPEPLSCPHCFLTYGDFCHTYTDNLKGLVSYPQTHGLLLSEKVCPECNSVSRIDLQKKGFRCDKSVPHGHKRRKRCNFFAGLFKGTWFEHSHLDLETNIKFVVLFLQDWFSYKCVRHELRLSDSTINDWCSFAREVCVNWVLKKSKKIGGAGKTVEIDESKFGKRKYNVGRLIEGQWVFGGIYM